jgi:ketosteroid isomerase-like protein
MSSANLDLVRSIYATTERGEYGRVDWADPEIEYVWVDGPAPRSGRGLAEMAEGMRNFLSAWEDFRTVVEEYRELDDDRVLVLLTAEGRGKVSGLDLRQTQARAADLVELSEGRVTRIVKYFDRDRALADLGLAPEGGAAEAPG